MRKPNQGYIKTGSGAKIVFALLVIFALLPSFSWGACIVVSQSFTSGFGSPPSSCANNCHYYGPTKGEVAANCGASISNCPSSYQSGAYYYTNVISAGVSIGGQTNWLDDGGYYGGTCHYCSSSTCNYMCRYGLRCSTQAEADSAKCANNPQADGCKDACTDSRNQCQAQGGIFSGSAASGRCLGTCNLCQTEVSKNALKRIGELCCQAGVAPPQNPQCVITGVDTSGVNQFEYLAGSLRCDFNNWESQQICQDIRDSLENLSSSSAPASSSSASEYCKVFPDDLACICASDPTNPDCAYLNSSSSEGAPEGSSGSTGSSGSGGGEGGEGSSGSGGSGGGGGDWEYDYRDSLHKIINTTARTANNTEGLRDSLGTIAFLLRFAPCLWGDCDTSNTDSLLGAVLDTTGQGAIGADTMASLGDSLAAFGDSLDSIDGSGFWGDCDTTGGKHCDDMLIGSNGVKGATDSLKTAFGVFGDSLQNGVVGDSLESWASRFTSGKLSGVGSDNCPAIFSKVYTIPLGDLASFDLTLGGVPCRAIFGGLTAWRLARTILRALVAIACMWFLFKCATGTGGPSDED